MHNPFSLKDKRILITGASSGIGKATAIECSKMGAQLIITGRNEKHLNETFQSLEGKNHLSFSGDLCDPSFLDFLSTTVPMLDGFVYSAGIVLYFPFKFLTNEKLNQLFDINFKALTLLSHSLIKKKKINKNGSIVFMSSISGVLMSYYGGSIYAATKGAINGLAKGMALELANQNIRVNTIIAGMVDTNILREDIITQEQLEMDVKRYPLGRYGKPEEIAHATIYLLSDASTWVTGSNLLIDGGISLK